MQPLFFLSYTAILRSFCTFHEPRVPGGKKRGGSATLRYASSRIPERRLSQFPLNIHPLGKPDKNKARALWSIVQPPSLWKHIIVSVWKLDAQDLHVIICLLCFDNKKSPLFFAFIPKQDKHFILFHETATLLKISNTMNRIVEKTL